MNQHEFELIPQIVFQYLAQLTYGAARYRDLEPHEYGEAVRIARAWSPPLVEPGTSKLTPDGDAALAFQSRRIREVEARGSMVPMGRHWLTTKELTLLNPPATETLARGSADDETKWIKQVDCAEHMGLKSSQIQRLREAGKIKDNGKKQSELRIDRISAVVYCEQEGIAWKKKR